MIKQKVKGIIRKFSMLNADDKVLVAVSGGFDSTALLYLLNSLKAKLHIKLYAVHLNHKLRGKDSELDEKFVKDTCRKLRVPLISKSIDVAKFAQKNKLGIEEAARKARYSFFEEISAKLKLDKIALAHNADDNIETFLMRLIRGTGLKGLTGIPAVRGNIIRPLIQTSRKDIEKYLKSKKIAPRTDMSNFDIKYTRNKIRHILLPALMRRNPSIKDSIRRAISSANTAYSHIEREVIRFFGGWPKGEIDLKKFSKLEPSLRPEVLRLAIESVKGSLADVSSANIGDTLQQVQKGKGEIHLPGVFVYIKKGKLTISKEKKADRLKGFKFRLGVPGKASGPGIKLDARIINHVPLSKLRVKNPYQAYLDHDKIRTPLIVRSRRLGDAYVPFGLKGRKKLQDIFVDEKIDLDERDRIPVIDDGRKIVWVVGYRISDDVKVTPDTRKIIRIRAERI